MDFIKNLFTKNYVKWKYSNETTPEFARYGYKIGLGLMFLAYAAFIFFR